MLEKLFHLKKHQTNIRTEIIAGITTFLTMCYILTVNPAILSQAGIDRGAVFVATAIASIIGTLIMAFVANWPVGLAPGMGLNGFFAYGVVLGMGYSWQQALGGVLISGIVFVILTLIGARKWLTEAIPQSLRHAITAGIGLFLAFVALKNMAIISKNDVTLIGLGDLTKPAALLMLAGFLLIALLNIYRIKGAVFLGMMIISLAYFSLYPADWSKAFSAGFMSMPPSLKSTFLQLDLSKIFEAGFFHVLLVFVLVELLDATGSLIGIGVCGGLITPHKPNNLNRALFADSCAICAGALIGTSSTTAYVESAAGIEAGGRTGLTALVIALCFGFSLFFAPIILAIPDAASSAALLFVACFMAKEMQHIIWDDLSEFVPALLAALIMPLTLSIANGLAFGFISYSLFKLLTGKAREVKLPTWIISLLFIIRYIIN